MTASTRTTVLSLYMRVFRIARTWRAQSGVPGDTEAERTYILQEARALFRQNQKLTEEESIKRCIEECEARIEIGENGEKLQIFFPYSCAELKPLQPKSVQNDATYTDILKRLTVLTLRQLKSFSMPESTLQKPVSKSYVFATSWTGNSEGQEAASTAAPQETGQTNLLAVT